LYSYANIKISSAWSLGDLLPKEPAPSNEPPIAISLLDAPPSEPALTDWIHHWQPQYGGMCLALSGNGRSFLLRFPSLADFVISRDGCHIDAWPAPATSIETLHHLLLDQVLPRVLAHQGRLVLHAGAVRVDTQAIAFIGNSGSGKSTLTASLHAAGYPLLSDDSLVLIQADRFIPALATYPSLRLLPDAISSLYAQPPPLAPVADYTTKQRVMMMTDLAAEAKNPLALAALYVLAPKMQTTANFSLTRLNPCDACIAIIGNSFQLDVTDRRRVADVFADASRIANRLPVFALEYPREFVRLPEVHEAILSSLANEPIARLAS
jgi:hypothetical protein